MLVNQESDFFLGMNGALKRFTGGNLDEVRRAFLCSWFEMFDVEEAWE
jgi:hypothetical protein